MNTNVATKEISQDNWVPTIIKEEGKKGILLLSKFESDGFSFKPIEPEEKRNLFKLSAFYRKFKISGDNGAVMTRYIPMTFPFPYAIS